MDSVDVYLETGSKRVFACSVAWPGWSRSGRDENGAITALVQCAERYGAAIGGVTRGFRVPNEVRIVERLSGGSTTDFGAPGEVPECDRAPLDGVELKRQMAILRACWRAFDAAAAAANGVVLRTGPRGGGRSLEKMVSHVTDAEASYTAAIGERVSKTPGEPPTVDRVHDAFIAALDGRLRGEIPAKGPRRRRALATPVRHRRTAWHVLDHAWELEDRTHPI